MHNYEQATAFTSIQAPQMVTILHHVVLRGLTNLLRCADPRRTKRTVQYRNPEDVWQYIGGGKRLAVQWTSWLSHTRPHPPTLEELQMDMARQQRVQYNVALIEARDREEALRLQQELATPALGRSEEHAPTNATPLQETQHSPEVDAATEPKNSLPKIGTSQDAYEPESWTPRPRTRRG
ncbi:hypothetical protein DXG01_000318 [Tephrocybe rancida]|nr:hypothetical protein DXG01_000318 [Tephrocybe rancida]